MKGGGRRGPNGRIGNGGVEGRDLMKDIAGQLDGFPVVDLISDIYFFSMKLTRQLDLDLNFAFQRNRADLRAVDGQWRQLMEFDGAENAAKAIVVVVL